jgi:hypothetical protein
MTKSQVQPLPLCAKSCPAQSSGNVHAAYTNMNLQPPDKLNEALADFAVIKIPETPVPLSFSKGLTRKTQPMIFIPLQHWNSNNGSPWKDEIEAGEGVVISGSAPIYFPSSGNCILIVIRLHPSQAGTVNSSKATPKDS